MLVTQVGPRSERDNIVQQISFIQKRKSVLALSEFKTPPTVANEDHSSNHYYIP